MCIRDMCMCIINYIFYVFVIYIYGGIFDYDYLYWNL